MSEPWNRIGHCGDASGRAAEGQGLNHYREHEAYGAHLRAYKAMFSGMTDMARSIWFFAADESEILSFEVGPGEAVEAAAKRHAVKLCAMADALASVQLGVPQDSIIKDLRRLASQHWPELGEKGHNDLARCQASAPALYIWLNVQGFAAVKDGG